MIGITFALPSESSGLTRRLQEVQRHDNLLSGKIDNPEIIGPRETVRSRAVTILHTGVGAKNCNARLEVLLHKARPSLVISSGFAGGVSEELGIGDLVLAHNFSDPALLANAEQILRDREPRVVKLFTSTSIIDSVAARNEIARAADAAAVDMETGAIADVCKIHGVPLLSLRIISDTVSQPFPAPPSVLFDIERQRTNFGGLLAYLLRDPGSIWPLFRFGRQIARARARLTDAIVALVREL
ncbi:MAG: adenosylhomocysteine nucleosidase [Verrucomicrobiota bacterium]|jgi:adenosylhomocysteine nucleosidase